MWVSNLAKSYGDQLYNFIIWLGDFVRDSKTGKPSVKRFGLALAVTVLCGVMLGMGTAITMITMAAENDSKVEMVRIVCSTLEALAFMVLTAVTTGYLVDRTQERKVVSKNMQANNNQD